MDFDLNESIVRETANSGAVTAGDLYGDVGDRPPNEDAYSSASRSNSLEDVQFGADLQEQDSYWNTAGEQLDQLGTHINILVEDGE